MSNNSKGSEWSKWDLHVHTPESGLAHSFGDNFDSYVENLIDAVRKHSISAIATADYFSIAGFRKLLSYYDPATRVLALGSKNVEVTILPGIELRLNIFNSEDDSVNIHVIFDPEFCAPDFIEQHFLQELKVSYRGADYPLKSQALLAIGKSIETGEVPNPGANFSNLTTDQQRPLIKKALATITLAKRDIHEALAEIDRIFEIQNLLCRPYLVAIVGKGHGGIRSLKWFEDKMGQQVFSRAGLIREDLTHTADIVFSNDPGDRDFYLGRETATPQTEVIARFKRLKPCVWGSDGHSFQSLLHPSNGNSKDYTWIKADATFEGLRQIVFEPSLRVRVQEEDPTQAETYAKLERIEIDLPDELIIRDKESNDGIPFCLRGKHNIQFSNNLTCVVGGRGSGKSTLVHLLYNAWQGRDLGKLFEVNSPLASLQLTGKDPLSKLREMVSAVIPDNTEFFLQNEIEKFARDIQAMSELVRHRLERLSSLDEEQSGLITLEQSWRSCSAELTRLLDAYDKMVDAHSEVAIIEGQIKTLKKQTEVITSNEYQQLQKSIERHAGSITAFENYSKEYDGLMGSMASLQKTVQSLNWSAFKGQDVLESIVADCSARVSELQIAFAEATKVYLDADFPTQLATAKVELKKLLAHRGMAPENIVELADATEEIAGLESRIRELRSSARESDEIYSRRDKILAAYGDAYKAYRQRFFQVSEQLQRSVSGLKFSERPSEITFLARTNESILKQNASEFIKANNQLKASLNSDSLASVLFEGEKSVEEMIADKTNIRVVVESSSRASVHTQVLKELVADDKFLEKLSLRMIRDYYDIENIQVQTKLGDKFLQNTSFGERCGIVVAIVLVAGTNPIVIDQPEDNLDGKFISNVLVPLIRKQKQHRQIVLVTRDANLVIAGDSELIMILETDDQGKTKTIPASIECTEQRSKYIWILDGGETAFRLREEKYSIVN